MVREKDTVFLVHGRDLRPKQVLEQFLHFAGLKVLSWSDAVALTGLPQPPTYTVLKAGMNAAAAAIVVFSPDEETHLRAELTAGGPDERGFQPRQSLLLEAGMAYALAPRRTIFVKSGTTRPITDVEGFHWVGLDGESDSRRDLINRLISTGATVNTPSSNLQDPLAGPFQVA